MYFSYFKLVSQENIKNREELQKDNNHLLQEVNNIKNEKEAILSEKIQRSKI